jgi:MFS family permease
MMPQLGAPVGFIAANGLFLLLGTMMTQEQFVAWGWRIPFLLSVVLVGIGLWVRLRLSETPAFAAMLEEGPPAGVPIAELVRKHGWVTLGATFGAVACFAVYYVMTAFTLGYGTKTLGIGFQTFLSLQLGAILFMAVGILLAGWASDRWSPGAVLRWGCVGAVASGLLLAPALQSGSLLGVFAGLSAGLFAMGFVYGPLGAWLPGLFPARVRYTGVSVAFNLAGVLGGGLTPFVAVWLAARPGGLLWVGLYLAGAAALSLLALIALRKRG